MIVSLFLSTAIVARWVVDQSTEWQHTIRETKKSWLVVDREKRWSIFSTRASASVDARSLVIG